MIESAREVDTVLVRSIDRLARNLQELQSIIMDLNDRAMDVEFPTERLLFHAGEDSPFDRLQMQMMGALAEFERA